MEQQLFGVNATLYNQDVKISEKGYSIKLFTMNGSIKE
jgi:hypothetical protein